MTRVKIDPLAFAFVVMAAALLLLGCGTNPPTPDPGPGPVDGCLSDLLTTWPGDAIACAVRALGIRSAISVAGGDAGATDRSVAPTARAWILGHNVQFRN
jgi:hypothetical protein